MYVRRVLILPTINIVGEVSVYLLFFLVEVDIRYTGYIVVG